MKTKLLFAGMMAAVMMTCAACDSEDSDNPTVPPAEGPEPLTEYLRPTLSDGKKWIVEKGVFNASTETYTTETYTEYVLKDTIVDGFSAKKIQLSLGDGNPYGFKVQREEDGMVFTWQLSQEPYYDFYRNVMIWGLDFNVNPQGSVTIRTARNNLVTVSRGTITLMGKMRRAVKVWCGSSKDHESSPYEYWVEGIGTLFGHSPIYNPIMPSTPTPKTYTRLLECYDGEQKIYDYREFSDDLYEPVETFTDTDQLQ